MWHCMATRGPVRCGWGGELGLHHLDDALCHRLGLVVAADLFEVNPPEILGGRGVTGLHQLDEARVTAMHLLRLDEQLAARS